MIHESAATATQHHHCIVSTFNIISNSAGLTTQLQRNMHDIHKIRAVKQTIQLSTTPQHWSGVSVACWSRSMELTDVGPG